MGMPQIPDGTNRPNLSEVVVDILQSVAVEELALAHLLNAEGEKLQEVVHKFSCDEICAKYLLSNCKCTTNFLNNVIMQEWILLNKIKSTLEVYETMEEGCKRTDCECRVCKRG